MNTPADAPNPAHDPAHILVVDDVEQNVRLLADLLVFQGWRVSTAMSGEQALERIATDAPDLVLLDVMMPGLSGYDVCRRLRAEPDHALLPIVLVTALDPTAERVKGLEAGADDFISKPINRPELMARVRSLLRIKLLHDQVQRQRAELADWNHTLERRVADGVAQVERLSQLKRFFSPALAEAILRGGADDPLKSHRREIVVVFLDLRGFTAFTETADPEEVMAVLREYHAAMGALILAHEGTLERFTGDGIMVFFNDPQPLPDAADHALRMALQMQAAMAALAAGWQRRGHALQLGIGVAMGYATIGGIGFDGRIDYGAIGKVTNLAARLCTEARGGDILAEPRVIAALGAGFVVEAAGEVVLKGFARPVVASRVVGWQPA
ncbi:adenylate/guanylate cyclase [Leptothrix cholodnii SP-6]|uniref:Adenylate/guanylate cyclase n=1 Tax=Leptothrix cholodnii (strain ATCC 51168 / LMG 8142 / SP-6) TaxID=395495 RepID=B1Y590_LEPCP|nr:adenylate/guanylate cyclase domain-containing response regulator [Leptothrix cholodnii]ACB32320.1 adenylate/guanylate cyclase [Leptothrix cholodnii SP-6]